MKMRQAGLRLLIEDHFNIRIIPGVGLFITFFSIALLALTLTYHKSMVSKSWKLRFGVCYKKSNEYLILMQLPLIGNFVEKQHEINSPSWSGKTTEDLASPSYCHKTAKIMFDEGAL